MSNRRFDDDDKYGKAKKQNAKDARWASGMDRRERSLAQRRGEEERDGARTPRPRSP
jgi:hypothetical protein